MEAVGNRVAAHANSFFYQGVLIGLHIDTAAEYGIVGLVFVDGAEFALQQPGGRVEPLQVTE